MYSVKHTYRINYGVYLDMHGFEKKTEHANIIDLYKRKLKKKSAKKKKNSTKTLK